MVHATLGKLTFKFKFFSIMAARGRGRGRGFNRPLFGGSDDVLPPVGQPPPLYPVSYECSFLINKKKKKERAGRQYYKSL